CTVPQRYTSLLLLIRDSPPTDLYTLPLHDALPILAYRGKQRSKFDYAQHVAACLAYLMLHQLDAVGLVTHDTRVTRPTASSWWRDRKSTRLNSSHVESSYAVFCLIKKT